MPDRSLDFLLLPASESCLPQELLPSAWLVGLPDISNNVGSVKLFLSTLLHSLRGMVLFVFFSACIDDHGSFVICRSASVRPRHLFDPYFDHDYFFELPLQGAGCPTKWTVF
jgi:hypothetical protein